MRILTAQARTKRLSRFAPFRRCPSTMLCSFVFELCPFCMAGVGHFILFHPRGRRGTFCTLLKRWQAWVKMRFAGGHFPSQAQYLVNFDDILPPCADSAHIL